MLRSVPIVKVILVILFQKKKKKEKKKKKNDPYFGMGKNTKVMPQKPRYLSFPWEREGILRLGLYQIQNLVRFLPCPPARKILFKSRHCMDDACQKKNSHKIDQKIHFLQISHLSSNRRVRNLTLYFQFTTLARELTHRMKFEYPGRHKFWTRHVSLLP